MFFEIPFACADGFSFTICAFSRSISRFCTLHSAPRLIRIYSRVKLSLFISRSSLFLARSSGIGKICKNRFCVRAGTRIPNKCRQYRHAARRFLLPFRFFYAEALAPVGKAFPILLPFPFLSQDNLSCRCRILFSFCLEFGKIGFLL